MPDFHSIIFKEPFARNISGLSCSQLRMWHKIGFYRSTLATRDERGLHLKYRFADLIALRVLYVLRQQYGVSLDALPRLAELLRSSRPTYWAGTNIYVLQRTVFVIMPDAERPQVLASKPRLAITLSMDDLMRDVTCETQALLETGENSVRVRGSGRPAPISWDRPRARYKAFAKRSFDLHVRPVDT